MSDKPSMSTDDTILAASAGSVDSVQEVMDKFFETARVESVYGKPVKHNNTLIIPTAEVLTVTGFGMGFGGGSGSAPAKETEEEGKEGEESAEKPAGASSPAGGGSGTGGGGGGGGGGRVLARPVAVIIADENGVHVEPIFDRTKVALAAFTAIGFVFAMMARMSRAGRRRP